MDRDARSLGRNFNCSSKIHMLIKWLNWDTSHFETFARNTYDTAGFKTGFWKSTKSWID